MKRLIKLTLLGALLMCSSSAFAQKFGYINFQELITLMPERDSIQVKITKMSDDYSAMLELMQVEFNNKYNDFQKNAATLTDAMRQMKERELSELDQRMKELYSTGMQELETTSNTLFAPVVEKAENAVKKVGADNGFTAVFDLSTRPIIYYDTRTLTDVTPLVKRELGIQ